MIRRRPRGVTFKSPEQVEIAFAAQAQLESEGVLTRVVSVPCFELFEAQSPEYRQVILGDGSTISVAIEAGIRQGWDRFIGRDGIFVGMTGFGASGPAPALYEHFGITAAAVVEAVRSRREASQ